ncbi:MAG: hypothetical protein RMK19_02210 [Bacteroidia bacterium]|nr:SPOR domain-containing protein [Bacteroidia bacterium]MDW8014809.1 hypothetical protein [Bacteroidia bacterium]
MAQIDFQAYIALLAAELPRFSVPGVGSFVWHVEKAYVDPKLGIVTPPRPVLKYEPGHRYQAETVAFFQEYFGSDAAEAEALLREVGRLASAYLKAANEMDLWKFGKIKRIGGLYKIELAEGAPIPFAMELYEVSLRAGAASSVAPPPVPTPQDKPKEKDKKDKPSLSDVPRARVVESPPSIEEEGDIEKGEILPQPVAVPRQRWGLMLVALALLISLLAAGVFWILRKRKPAQPVEIVLSKSRPTAEPSSEVKPPSPEKPTTSSTSPTLTLPEKKSSEAKPSPSLPSPPSSPSKASPPPPPKPSPSSPVSGRYYIIVGSYPSRSEAEEKARQFSGYSIEYLPGKEPGWVRISIFSSSDRMQVQQKLREIKTRVPDAWVYMAP